MKYRTLCCVVMGAASLWAQTTGQGSGVADAARSAKEGTEQQKDSEAARRARAVVQKMEDARENKLAAPPGYIYYEGQGYRILLPAPIEIQSRDAYATRITSMGSTIMFFAGNSMPLTKTAYWQVQPQDLARQFSAAEGFGQVYWGESKSENHKVLIANFSTGHLYGTAMAFFGDGRIIPVACANMENQTEHLIYGNPRSTYKQKNDAYAAQAKRFANEKDSKVTCQVLFNSMQLAEDGSAALPVPDADPQAAARSLNVLQQSNPRPQDVQFMPSLAELARARSTPDAGRKAALAVNNSESGNRDMAPFEFSMVCTYGSCRKGTIMLPAKASKTGDAWENVFEMETGRSTASFYVGRVGHYECCRMSTDKVFVNWQRITGTAQFGVTELVREERKINGFPVTYTRFQVAGPVGNLIGEKIEFPEPQNKIAIGCAVAQEQFGDFEPICMAMLNSLVIK